MLASLQSIATALTTISTLIPQVTTDLTNFKAFLATL